MKLFFSLQNFLLNFYFYENFKFSYKIKPKYYINELIMIKIIKKENQNLNKKLKKKEKRKKYQMKLILRFYYLLFSNNNNS